MKAFFDLLDRHKIGILSTILLHLVITTAFLVVSMRSKNVQQTNRIVLDFSQDEDMQKELEEMQKKEKMQASPKEFIKEMQQEYLGKTIPVNEADESDAKKSIEQMESEIKKELGVSDYSERDTGTIQKIEPPKKKETPQIEKKKDFINEKGEPSVFRGATTISYNLKGRQYLYIPTPQYQCEKGGKVTLDVVVNPKGYVLSAEPNYSKSQISEECIIESATKAALTTRFDEKPGAPAKQPGTITFIFVAQ